MDSSQLHTSTDLQNLPPDSGRTDHGQTSHPPACPDEGGLEHVTIENSMSENGDMVGFQGSAHDVSERLRTQNELALSELRFLSFFEQAAVGMVVVSETGAFLHVNQRFADIIGYTQQEIVGHLCTRASHPENCACEAALIAQLERDHPDWQ